MDSGLVFVGKVVELSPIPNADRIVAATVVCGPGGKWRGVVKKGDFVEGNLCIVYLPDSIIPESNEMKFLEKHKWRVKMCRFKGAPSEVLIMSYTGPHGVGFDLTNSTGVTKYFKPVPADLACEAKGPFPGFIPKTDELNYQSNPELVDALVGKPYYITEKADGASTTVYRYKGEFGVCSRHWELIRDESKGQWQVVTRYKLEERLPEGIALQFECCGPKIQSNPMGLKEVDGFAFSAYHIPEHRYLEMNEFIHVCQTMQFPFVPVIDDDDYFSKEGVELLGEGKYPNGKEREGVVVRSQFNIQNGKPISFKVINLNYEN